MNADGTIWLTTSPFSAAMLPGDDALWSVLDTEHNTREVRRIDPADNTISTVVTGIPVLPNPVHGLAVNGSIWISSWDMSSAIEYDASTGEELARHDLGLHPIEPSFAFGDVWSPNHDGGSVSRIDTTHKAVTRTIELEPPESPRGMAQGGEYLWVVGLTDRITAIDPGTNKIGHTIDTGLTCLTSVAYIANRLAVAGCSSPGVALFDPETGEALGMLDEAAAIGQPLEAGGRLWLARAADGDYVDGLVALDPGSLEVVDELDLPERFTVAGYAVAFDSIWISGEPGVLRVPAEALTD